MINYEALPPAVQNAMEAEREEFEEKMYRAYFMSQVNKELKLKDGVVDKNTFCKRNPEDVFDYDDTDLSAMWFAWLHARNVFP